jgi:hypothetical protein
MVFDLKGTRPGERQEAEKQGTHNGRNYIAMTTTNITHEYTRKTQKGFFFL